MLARFHFSSLSASVVVVSATLGFAMKPYIIASFSKHQLRKNVWIEVNNSNEPFPNQSHTRYNLCKFPFGPRRTLNVFNINTITCLHHESWPKIHQISSKSPQNYCKISIFFRHKQVQVTSNQISILATYFFSFVHKSNQSNFEYSTAVQTR